MEWATAIRDLLANNAGLPYSDLSAVENQLSSLGLYHFQLGISQFSYKDGSSKTLIGFSGLIESRKKHNLAIVGWLTPDFPRAPPDIYLLAKYDEVLEANHQWVRPCGKVDIPYLQQWKNHSILSILIVELVGAFGSWPPFIKRRNNKLTPSVSSTKIPEGITDEHLRNGLKNLISDFPELGVHLRSTPIPLIKGYIPITYHGKNYKVQIQIRLAGYPHRAPQVYILWDRTKSCIREDSQYVSSTTGLVHIPLLQNWSFRLGLEDYCTLVGLVWNMVGLFSLHPPVRSGICVPSNSGTTSYSNVPSNSGTASNSNEEKREEENTEGAGSDYERQQKDSENELKMFESSGWRGFFDG
ncbi:putative ubiquitin-conjugating enzyme/RWD [Rosa chinensis]|uniref:Putative ubiquitin-conjugating enzyme/RWD n=1 Tax=Rosa chinensis TaxID=74649 RepID=A0A2P6PKY3_ROSCH|nr:putative ubiquitin-conjugating enzyme/RWD [Rosa chinensis]